MFSAYIYDFIFIMSTVNIGLHVLYFFSVKGNISKTVSFSFYLGSVLCAYTV